MKKNIMLGFVLVMMMFTLTGCGSKNALTTDNFKTISKNNSYAIIDVISQYEVYNYVTEATVAQSSDGWQVEFYVLSDNAYATGMFNNNKSIFEGYKGSSAVESSSSMGNYETYSLTSDGYYMYLCRVDNTLFYARVEDTYKDAVKNFVEELGY